MAVVRNVTVEYQFFSVKKPVIFGGKSYRPSICYRLTADIFDTVSSLAEVGDAVLYEHAVRFVSGRVRDANAKAIPEPILTAPSTEATIKTETAPAAAEETAGVGAGVKLGSSASSRKRSSSASSAEIAGEFQEQGTK